MVETFSHGSDVEQDLAAFVRIDDVAAAEPRQEPAHKAAEGILNVQGTCEAATLASPVSADGGPTRRREPAGREIELALTHETERGWGHGLIEAGHAWDVGHEEGRARFSVGAARRFTWRPSRSGPAKGATQPTVARSALCRFDRRSPVEGSGRGSSLLAFRAAGKRVLTISAPPPRPGSGVMRPGRADPGTGLLH